MTKTQYSHNISYSSINFDDYELQVDNSSRFDEPTYVKINMFPKNLSKQYCLCNFSTKVQEMKKEKERKISSFNHHMKEKLRGRIEKSHDKIKRLHRYKKGFLIDRETTEFWTFFEFIKVWTSREIFKKPSNTSTQKWNEAEIKIKELKKRSMSSIESTTCEDSTSECL